MIATRKSRNHRILTLIPARSGSKGIPKKNLQVIGGLSLVEWAIEVAIKAGLNDIVLSSDSEEILELGKKYSIRRLRRPCTIANDESKTIEVVLHALESMGSDYDAVLLLQPTSPLRSAEDVEQSIVMLRNYADATSIISVVDVGAAHPLRAFSMLANQRLTPYLNNSNEFEGVPRQILPPAYVPNGAIYLTKTETLLSSRSFWGDSPQGFVMPLERSVNIDSPLDLEIARFFVEKHVP